MNIRSLAVTELAGLQSDREVILVDVREAAEVEIVSLPDSIWIPLGELPARVAEIPGRADPESPEIVVYCHHGIRSQLACKFLSDFGFEKLWNLTGGIDEYAQLVDPQLPRY